MLKARLVLLGLLATFAFSSTTSASATGRKPGWWVCVTVPSGRGTWNNGGCNSLFTPFNHAWAYFNSTGQLWACEKGALGIRFENPTCTMGSLTGSYAWTRWGSIWRVPGKLSASKFAGTVSGEKLTIECTGGKSTTGKLEGQELEGGGEVLSKEMVITSEGCKVAGALGESCAVTVPATAKLKGKETTEGRVEVTFSPEEGTTFIEVTLNSIEGKTCPISGKSKITGSQTCEVDKSNTEAGETQLEHTLSCKPAGSSLELAAHKAEYEVNVMGDLEVESTSKAKEAVEYALEE